MPLQSSDPRVIVALDFADLGPARELVRRVDPSLCRLKVGKEMYTRYGPHFVAELTKAGFDVFLESRGYYFEWMREEWMTEENPLLAARLLLDPEGSLRALAPAYKAQEAGMEQIFWSSRFAR